MATKRCPACGEVKAVGEFGRNKARADGLGSQCKVCNRDRKRIANLPPEKLEARRESDRQRLASMTPDQRAAKNEYMRQRWAAKRLALYESYLAAEAAALTPEDFMEHNENGNT